MNMAALSRLPEESSAGDGTAVAYSAMAPLMAETMLPCRSLGLNPALFRSQSLLPATVHLRRRVQ